MRRHLVAVRVHCFSHFSLPKSTQIHPNGTNNKPFHQRHTTAAWFWNIWLLREFGPYLGVILEHLIPLHVVTLEHDDGSVEAGDVQTEVVCPDFFIRRVRKHLESQMSLSENQIINSTARNVLHSVCDTTICQWVAHTYWYLFVVLFIYVFLVAVQSEGCECHLRPCPHLCIILLSAAHTQCPSFKREQ